MAAEKAPNVLFLLSDEHAFRYLSCLDPERGGEPVHTPTLDELAGTGAYFENAYCQMPLCTPSRMCLLTGRDQQNCGAWDNGAVLPPDVPTIPGHLAEVAGYETCLIGKMHFGGSRQFNGFRHRPYGDIAGGLWLCGHQADPLVDAVRGDAPGPAPFYQTSGVTSIPESALQEQVVVRESIAFLREHQHRAPDQPWFLCASFSRPHSPFTAPARHFERYWPEGVTEPKVGTTGDTADHPLTEACRKKFGFDRMTHEETMRTRAAYFACVDYLDEILGDFLRCLDDAGFGDNTIVVYTSDHGELAGEHGLWFKTVWHEASVRVPLVVRLPEHRAGVVPARTMRTPVGLGDLFPTLCGLIGVPAPAGLDGTDLSNAIRRSAEPDRAPVLSQSLIRRYDDRTRWRMVRQGRYKYVMFAGAPDLLFDLETDPGEQTNLVARPEYADVLGTLRELARAGSDDVFADAETKRRAGRELVQTYANKVEPRTGNQLLLPDGRLVEADTALYEPVVLTDNPSEAFDDWP